MKKKQNFIASTCLTGILCLSLPIKVSTQSSCIIGTPDGPRKMDVSMSNMFLFSGNHMLEWPIEKPVINQEFGENPQLDISYNFGHQGLDLSSYKGASIKASRDGIIVSKYDKCPDYPDQNCNYGDGNLVDLWHPDVTLNTRYMHLGQTTKKNIGDRVRSGEIIGTEGSSGKHYFLHSGELLTKEFSGVHHLHFEVGIFNYDKDGKYINTVATCDPRYFLK